MSDACRSLVLCAALLAVPASALSGVHKWVDENGVTHYTIDRESIPSHLRARLQPSGKRTATAPTPAPVELPPGVDMEVIEGVRPEDVGAALSLEKEIARDRETIKDLISRQGQTGAGLAEDAKLREIADRLPRLQSESAELKKAQD